jgi:3-oxoacyl-[acyl-carrier protein] reductase
MPNSYDLTGKTAVVTGGAKGIGGAIVDCLVASGVKVWVWDADPVRKSYGTVSLSIVSHLDQSTLT